MLAIFSNVVSSCSSNVLGTGMAMVLGFSKVMAVSVGLRAG